MAIVTDDNSEVGGHFFTMDLMGEIDLASSRSTIEVLKTGKIHDRPLTITKEMLDDYVANWAAGVYGSDLQVNLSHDREGEAAGWIKNLFVDGETLKAEVEWTPLGQEKVASKQFRYISSELAPSYPDVKTGKKVNNVFIGCALTNVPAVKGMAPVSLSEGLQLFLNSQCMAHPLEAVHGKLMDKEKLTKSDLESFNKKMEGLDEEDMPAAKKMAKKLASKYGEQEPDEDDKAAKASEEGGDDEIETVSLSEHKALEKRLELAEKKAVAQDKKNAELAEKIERQELAEQIVEKCVLSEDRSVGFKDDDDTMQKVSDFLMSLSAEARTTFLEEIMPAIQYVDLSVHGEFGVISQTKKIDKNTSVQSLAEGSEADAIVARSHELLNEKKAKNIEEAQKMAINERKTGVAVK